MNQPAKNAASFLDRLKSMDPEAYSEVVQTQESVPGQPTMMQETIVLLKGRPVLDIKGGQAVLDINEIESQVWKTRLQSSLGMLNQHVPAVGRIELQNHVSGFDFVGTGWFVRDNIVVTNRHVASLFAGRDNGKLVFAPGLDGTPVRAMIDFIEEFGSSAAAEFPLFDVVHIEGLSGPDIAFLRVEPIGGQQLPPPISLDGSMADVGDQVAVIGYPARDPNFPQPAEMDRIFGNRYDKKRLAPGMVTKSNSTEFLHDCSTLGGNSGSEIVSLKSGKAVALHFAGTLFTANHAVPIPIVIEKLDKVVTRSSGKSPAAPVPPSPSPDSSSATGEVKEDSQAQSVAIPASERFLEMVIPIRIRVEIGEQGQASFSAGPSAPSSAVVSGATSSRPDDELMEVSEARPEDYRNRRGYDPKFLGEDFEAPLPKFIENKDDILEFEVSGKKQTELRYTHFSVVMSRSRRMCRFSACNVDGLQSKSTVRAAWRMDPRIPDSAQILKECYGNEPKFSRGHMTRREDPAWGTKAVANLGNTDSMHVTNTVPQMQPFNGGIWLELEDYALQNAREDEMRISVFTGPFLASNDPFRFGVKIPISFWKILIFVHDETGELSATGYTMSQKSFLPAPQAEFVFGEHKHNQRSIRSIAARAGFDFGILADIDPLRDEPESIEVPLKKLSDIRFKR